MYEKEEDGILSPAPALQKKKSAATLKDRRLPASSATSSPILLVSNTNSILKKAGTNKNGRQQQLSSGRNTRNRASVRFSDETNDAMYRGEMEKEA